MPVDGVLGRAVGDPAGVADRAHLRGQGDDAARARRALSSRSPKARQARNVARTLTSNSASQSSSRVVARRPRAVGARGGDEHAAASPRLRRLVDHGGDLALVGRVGDAGDRLPRPAPPTASSSSAAVRETNITRAPARASSSADARPGRGPRR